MQGFMSGEASMRWSRRTSMTQFKAVLLGSALAFPLAFSANAMTLQEAVQQAIATNPDIGIVASNREAVDQELRQARGRSEENTSELQSLMRISSAVFCLKKNK